MQISSRPVASYARPAHEPKVWAPDAVLAPPLGYQPEETPASLLGGLIIAQKIAEQEANASTHPPYEPKIWAPDAVLAPPLGYQPEETPASLLGGLIIAQKIAEQEANASTHPPYEPKVWAPDAVLAPPPGYQPEKTKAPETVSFFGVELPIESFGLIHQGPSKGNSLY